MPRGPKLSWTLFYFSLSPHVYFPSLYCLAFYLFYCYHSKIPRMVDYQLCCECSKCSLACLLHLQGSRMCEDYINFSKSKTCMAMRKKAWMTTYLFTEQLVFFNRFIPKGISQEKCYILILNGYRSHVTIEVVKPWNSATWRW